jgi:putative oxidoreductase
MSLISAICLVADVASVRALYNGKEKSMVEITGRKCRIAIRVLRVLPGLAFLTIGIAKLTGTLYTVQTFEAFGWGQWFRYLTGLLDLAGALLVFVPRWSFYGALLLSCTVGLATVLSLRRPPDFWPALSLTLLAATLAWLTRPRLVS